MTPALTLDQIREDIVARRDRAQRLIDREVGERDQAEAELIAHDRAVALFVQPGPPARRNIAALVLARLTGEPQTVEQLAKAIGVGPRQVGKALVRLSRAGQAACEAPWGLGWLRVGGLAS